MTVEKIYWDSDCFLGHFQAEAGKAEKCDGVLQRAERGEVLIVTSALTLAEVLWMRGGPRLPIAKAELVQKFFRRSYIRVYNVTRKISESAQLIVWEGGIKPKDAIHVATAIDLGVTALETFDNGLIGKSGKVGEPLLLIREPQSAAQGRLNLARSPEDTARPV
ncbi:MAG: type II toxin-antitoxin system VapC family toxin [Roseibium sp.]